MSNSLKVGDKALILGMVAAVHMPPHLEQNAWTVALRGAIDGQPMVTNVGNVVRLPELPDGMALEALLQGIEAGEFVLMRPGAIASLPGDPDDRPKLGELIPGEPMQWAVGRRLVLDEPRLIVHVQDLIGRDLTPEEAESLIASAQRLETEEEAADADEASDDDEPSVEAFIARLSTAYAEVLGRDLTEEEANGLAASVQRLAEPEPAEQAEPAEPVEFVLPGVAKVAIDALKEKGIDSLDAVRKATDEALLAVDGIGPVVLARIRKHLEAVGANQQ